MITLEMKRMLTSLILGISIVLLSVVSPATAADKTREIGIQAYIYAYPIVNGIRHRLSICGRCSKIVYQLTVVQGDRALALR